MQRYEAVLFDFDGVIIDSEPIHFDCWKQVLEPHGVQMDWDSDRPYCVGISDREMIEYLSLRMEKPAPVDQLWNEYERKNEIFIQRTAENPPIPDEIRVLLAELEGRYKLAIVSSSSRNEVEPILKAGGIRFHFQVVVTGDDVQNYKPDPEPYRLAASRLGVRRALVVEDSQAGENSGLAAGFDVVRVPGVDRTPEMVRTHLAIK